jgi:hypothetical protein
MTRLPARVASGLRISLRIRIQNDYFYICQLALLTGHLNRLAIKGVRISADWRSC